MPYHKLFEAQRSRQARVAPRLCLCNARPDDGIGAEPFNDIAAEQPASKAFSPLRGQRAGSVRNPVLSSLWNRRMKFWFDDLDKLLLPRRRGRLPRRRRLAVAAVG